MSGQYIDRLSGVRGIAALVVLLSHVVQIHFLRFVGLDTPLHRVSSVASEYAVIVFFILSGYLITHSLEANIRRNGRLHLREYLAARAARLYPPFLLAIAISVAIYIAMSVFTLPGRGSPLSLPGDLYAARDIVHLGLSEVMTALLMLRGLLEINGPLWSLYIEAKLYVLAACALALLTGHRRTFLLVMVMLIVVWYGIRHNPGFGIYSAIWIAGGLGYYLWNDQGREVSRSRPLLCGGSILVIVGIEVWSSHAKALPIWLPMWQALSSLLIAGLLFRSGVLWPRAQRLADCSYSLYVTHFPILLLMQSLLVLSGSDSWGHALLVASVSIVLAGGVAMLCGRIEQRKSTIQVWLLAFTASITRQLQRVRGRAG
jgi:peptidoglycan/LPS O-acetylase OafA/YrhL